MIEIERISEVEEYTCFVSGVSHDLAEYEIIFSYQLYSPFTIKLCRDCCLELKNVLNTTIEE